MVAYGGIPGTVFAFIVLVVAVPSWVRIVRPREWQKSSKDDELIEEIRELRKEIQELKKSLEE